MERKTQNIGDIFDLIKRRKYYLLIPLLAVFSIAVIVALALPPTYKSSTTILIEGQQIPRELVQATVTEFVERSIQTITQRIMSRSKLTEIIDEFNLYNDLRKRQPTEKIIERMREDINLEMISAEVIDERTGRPSTATIAFNLSYEWNEPRTVQKVASRLASLYLEANLKDREEKAKATSIFLEAELKALRDNMSEMEAKVAVFKEKHFQALPEMAQLNFQMVERFERGLERIEQDIKMARERKIYLEGQRAGVDPDLPGIRGPRGQTADAKQRLRYLRTENIALKASLSEKHPDLVKIEKEIESFENGVSPEDDVQLQENQLEELQTELAQKMGKFSDRHPDVIKLKKTIEVLQREIEEMGEDKGKAQVETEPAENPAYINLSTQIETTNMDIEALGEEQKRLKAKLEAYQKRLELTPRIELEYKLLTRDYDNSRRRYQEILDKLMLAKSAEGLEKGQKGQKFTIIDPAILPEKPYKPNRLAIVLIGFVLSIGAGVGIAALKEFSDRAVRSEVVLAHLTKRPVLAVVPFIETAADLRRKRRKRVIFSFSFVTGTGLCVLAVHMFYRPMDVLWFKVLRKLVELGLVS